MDSLSLNSTSSMMARTGLQESENSSVHHGGDGERSKKKALAFDTRQSAFPKTL